MGPNPSFQKDDVIGGRYRVLQSLVGGMSEVYICLDAADSVLYAVKTIQNRYLKQLDRYAEFLSIFQRELATWIALEYHPNIVHCHFMQTIENRPFIFLEPIVSEKGIGTDLYAWLQAGPLDVRLAFSIATDICRGLVHANEKQPGIVHRDLKPGNILIGNDGVAKITDFGLAKIAERAAAGVNPAGGDALADKASRTGIGGTPLYMAPEQWRGEPVDQRTDIYGLGCVLFEMLAGRPPYADTSIGGIYRQHCEAPIPRLPPRTYWTEPFANLAGGAAIAGVAHDQKQLVQDLDAVVARCLAKKADERFASAVELEQELERLFEENFASALKPTLTSESFPAVNLNNRGTAYNYLGRYSDAIRELTRAIEMDPNWSWPYTNRGVSYLRSKRYDDALADTLRSIELDPTRYAPYGNLGSIYKMLGRYPEAQAAYSHAIELSPANPTAYVGYADVCEDLGDHEQALSYCKSAIMLDSTFVRAYKLRSRVNKRLHRYREAAADLEQAVRLDPGDPELQADVGLLHFSMALYHQALADFTRAIVLDPNLGTLYSLRALTHQALEQFSEALADFNIAIQLGPADSMAYHGRAVTYRQLGQLAPSIADHQRAIELTPKNPKSFMELGITHVAFKMYDAAIEDFGRAIALDANDADAYLCRANVLDTVQRHQQALGDYAQALRLSPRNAIVYLNRAHTYWHMGHTEQALSDYLEAVRLNPSLAQAYHNIGLILQLKGALRESLPYLERAAQLGFPESLDMPEFQQLTHGSRPPSPIYPSASSVQAFLAADSLLAMRLVVEQFPFLASQVYLVTLPKILAGQGDDNSRELERKLAWLEEIINEQAESSKEKRDKLEDANQLLAKARSLAVGSSRDELARALECAESAYSAYKAYGSVGLQQAWHLIDEIDAKLKELDANEKTQISPSTESRG